MDSDVSTETLRPPSENTSNATTTGTPRQGILIVEDDGGIRDTLRITLKLENYDVNTCANGQEALDALTKIPKPSLILLDLMMPVLDGWEFTAALEKIPDLRDIPILVLTAFAGQATGIKAQAVITKPVDLEVLLSEIKKHCPVPNEP